MHIDAMTMRQKKRCDFLLNGCANIKLDVRENQIERKKLQKSVVQSMLKADEMALLHVANLNVILRCEAQKLKWCKL